MIESLIYFTNYTHIVQVSREALHHCAKLYFNKYFIIFLIKYQTLKLSIIDSMIERQGKEILNFDVNKPFTTTFIDSRLNNIIYHASCGGNLSTLKYILYMSSTNDPVVNRLYSDVNVYNLLEAVYETDRIDILDYLLKSRVISIMYAGNTLVKACEDNKIEVVKCLVNHGADIRFETYLPFRTSCFYGHIELVKYLHSLSPECISSYNNYAIELSCMNGHTEVVKYLISEGADVSINNYSSFRLACVNNRTEIVEYILYEAIKHKSEKIRCVMSNCNLIFTILFRNGYYDMIRYLLDNGVDPQNNNCYVLVLACTYNVREIVDYILDELITDRDEKCRCIKLILRTYSLKSEMTNVLRIKLKRKYDQ